MSVESRPEIKLSVIDHHEDDKRIKVLIQRAQWLRAAILGANDGLLSTTSLMLGVGAAKDDQRLMIISGIAGAVAGAFSMAVGEFVSVSTQRDIEHATIEKCDSKEDMSVNNDIYEGVKRQESTPVALNSFVEPIQHKASPAATPLARSPFMKVIASDHLQEAKGESSVDDKGLPNPYKAAVASGVTFLCGSLVPLLSAMVSSQNKVRVVTIVVVTSIALIIFGGAGARLGGSPVRVSAMRVLVGGWISMAVTYGLLKPLDRDRNGHETH
ncbi:hypothetical protein BUALT_Bualt11G0038200 [Buddleja alternifolia]|uniref:Vacuolar iron transporter n=1 Tax=Buddleja alternifolia TaxID=168488 RepID=A0AAV6X2Z2_9LAMI|nr:hypothetical protein BUALT_Bualt11G0038200 [Buddleja alternifolia]